jgi:segregation and condensation protein A
MAGSIRQLCSAKPLLYDWKYLQVGWNSMTDTEKTERTASTAAPIDDAYIVDEATDEVLRLHLENFEGPFEVLLYLIKAQEIDIFDIPIMRITEQYLRFLELMQEENLDIVGDFIVMAATLIQIKSKMLLPVEMDGDEEEPDEGDPRLELVEKLLEYRKYKAVMARLQALEEERQNWFSRSVKPVFERVEDEDEYAEVNVYDLIEAFRGVLRFFSDGLSHTVVTEGASIDEKIAHIQELLEGQASVALPDLFKECRSRVEAVCCFLAILELCRMGLIRAHQHQIFGDIRVFAATRAEADVVSA